MFQSKSKPVSDATIAHVAYLKKRKHCECGNPATIRKGNWHICERCYTIEQMPPHRAKSEGDGYEPIVHKFHQP